MLMDGSLNTWRLRAVPLCFWSPTLSVVGLLPVVLHGAPGLDLTHVTLALGLGPFGENASARLGAVTWTGNGIIM